MLDDAFIDAGSRQEQPRLVEILGAILRSHAPGGQLRMPMVLRLAEHRMCHGCVVWGQGLSMFVYFEEADVGFYTYQRGLFDDTVVLARFSILPASGWPTTRQRASA